MQLIRPKPIQIYALVFKVLFTTAIFGVEGTSFGAAGNHTEKPGRLQTQLTSNEIAREALDEHRYPHFMQFLKTVDTSSGIHPTDPRNALWVKSSHYFAPSATLWDGFFRAAAADHLTCLRAFALMAREVKKNGMIIFGPGDIFENAVKKNKIDLGLAIPAHDIGAAIWSPDPANQDPEFLVHIKVFYSESYIHQFPNEVLPANLKIGFRDPQSYWLNGNEFKQPAIDADIYYGPDHGVGFRHISGVGGQKRGVMGFFQKVLFFLPDAIHSMTINEDKGEMLTEALMNTTVKDFEKNPIYSIKVKTNTPQ